MLNRRRGFYEKYIKRFLDIVCSLLAIVFFGWLYVIIAIIVRIKMGPPVIFKQPRPGLIGRDGKEKIFDMYKFRTMTDERDEEGRLLPDKQRLPAFGRMLRATSLDELPEVINILKGDMSIIGPRPQLVKDMVFMTDTQRLRHSIRPGLSGLAQIRGRNAVSWDDKLNFDLEYIKNITFFGDAKIVFQTFIKVIRREGITGKDQATAVDFGDYLLNAGRITQWEYSQKQREAEDLLGKMDHV